MRVSCLSCSPYPAFGGGALQARADFVDRLGRRSRKQVAGLQHRDDFILLHSLKLLSGTPDRKFKARTDRLLSREGVT